MVCRVDAATVCLEDRSFFGSKLLSLPPCRSSKPHAAQEAVRLQGSPPKDFREPTRPDPAIQLHLPEPILSVNESLAERGIFHGAGKHVRYAMFVPQNFDWPMQPSDHQSPIDGGKPLPHHPPAQPNRRE